MSEPNAFNTPWHANGKLLYTAHSDFIGEMEHTDDARLVVDAVNERDRLRDALNEVCRRVSVALNCPRNGEEAIDLFVHDLLGIKECARTAIGEEET